MKAPAGSIQTVLGPIEPQQLGATVAHEHLLIDLSPLYKTPLEATARDLFYQPVSLRNVGYLRHHGMSNADDSKLMDVETAIEEASLYRRHGGGAIVDATSVGIARDPTGLAQVSRASGLHVIMGSSYYVDQVHPSDMDARTEEDIVAEIVRDISDGADGTDVRAGIIGEVGCSWPLTDNERKVLRASGRAQRLTGAPVLIHPGRDEQAPLEIIEVLREVGADLGRTIMGHLDRTVARKDTLKRIAESGCYLEWDLFGREESYYKSNPQFDMPTDAMRMDTIAWISSEGYGDRVVIAQDICHKNRLVRYGGHGYFYILARIVPRMRERGFGEEAVRRILVDNPAAVLTFAEAAGA